MVNVLVYVCMYAMYICTTKDVLANWMGGGNDDVCCVMTRMAKETTAKEKKETGNNLIIDDKPQAPATATNMHDPSRTGQGLYTVERDRHEDVHYNPRARLTIILDTLMLVSIPTSAVLPPY